MSAANPAMASDNHDQWAPMLKLAAEEVFDLMLGSPLSVPGDALPEEKLDITSMVGLAGKLCGVMSIRCSTKTAAQMASKMLGIDAENAGQEMWDAVGEVCNMVAGNFKNKISGLGDGCMLSVPTVITGGDYNLHPLTDDDGFRTTLLFNASPVVFSLQIHS